MKKINAVLSTFVGLSLSILPIAHYFFNFTYRQGLLLWLAVLMLCVALSISMWAVSHA